MTRLPRPSVTATLATGALVVALSGAAAASTGHAMRIGKANSASKPTVLRNPKGTSLVLDGKAGKPPFTVNGNTTQVPSLNVSRLGGSSASSYGGQRRIVAGAGSHHLTIPRGVHGLRIELFGAGGGGGDVPADDHQHAGSSGGQGGEGIAWLPVKAGQHFVVVLGAGGTAGKQGAGGQGQESVVRRLGDSDTEWIVKATGGAPGLPPSNCDSVNGGVGGDALGPTSAELARRAIGITAATGRPGSGTYSPAGCLTYGGAGGGFGFVGAGGAGAQTADGPTAVQAGHPGLAILTMFS